MSPAISSPCCGSLFSFSYLNSEQWRSQQTSSCTMYR